MSRDTERVPEWQIERFRLNELPRSESEAVRRAAERSDEVRARLAELDRSDREIVAAHPTRLVAAAIRERAARRPTSGPLPAPRAHAALALVVSAAAILLWVSVLLPPSRGPARTVEPADETRIKGLRPGLMLYRQGSPSPESLPDGALVHPREVIQVLYVAAGSQYGVIASVDGRGAVTVHLPVGEPRSAELTADRPTPLASAYELDDAPAFERFFFVTSERPFAVAMVADAVRRFAARSPGPGGTAARLDLPSSFGQSSFVLRKDPPR